MKLRVLTLGKTHDQWLLDALAEYTGRLKHYISFSWEDIELPKGAGQMSLENRKKAEGEKILDRLKPNTRLWLLDDKGKTFHSRAFAAWMEKMLPENIELTLVIGGAYGFSAEVEQKALGKISLSALTFSHQLVRVVLAEQLYRAFTIIRGEAYHHD
jgi:23S rRNA (pseudouridine1915-N3)-methyltransferase